MPRWLALPAGSHLLRTHARRRLGALFALSLLAGCADQSDELQLPQLENLSSAPAAIRRAADAVVRIRVPSGISGTGSFLSDSGLLMTNNHVLGIELCAVEGCWVELSFRHQRGAPVEEPRDVYAVPQHVDVGLDLAVLQVFESDDRAHKLDTPNSLEFAADADSDALVGRQIYIVGHPRGRLKKWSSGAVVGSLGSWFETTALTLPGDSGSPVLDADGRIVGLIHRGQGGEGLFTQRGTNFTSLCSAAALIQQALNAPLPPLLASVAADSSAEEVVANSALYLNSASPEAQVDGRPQQVLSLLASACDAALARDDFTSPEDLSDALQPCWDALNWIECRSDAEDVARGAVCPAGEERAWTDRFRAMFERQRALNGELDLTPLSFGVAQLAESNDDGDARGRASLLAALDEAQPLFDFSLAPYLAAFSIDSYAGQSTLDKVTKYTRTPHFELSGAEIASAALWLSSYGELDGKQTLGILRALLHNPRVDIGAKLYIEDVLYNSDAL
jgi:hypothetical protein